jgi:starch phosphorylase
MSNLQTFQVLPSIPKALSFLETLSRNYWWCWKKEAIELFRRIDPRLWEEADRNPLRFFTLIPQERFEELTHEQSFIAHLDRVQKNYEERILSNIDQAKYAFQPHDTIAYFSMEFGIHKSLPIYAGGLGMLAGDHLKAASNLGLPLTGVGLLYRQGYFRQYLNQDGWQQEEYPEADIFHLPLERAKDQTGKDLRVSVSGPDGEIRAVVWKVLAGRIALYLLDTNLPENPPHIREITNRLYTGDDTLRLAQEMLLGIGGMKALTAMGLHTVVCHMNEGHSAFASLERIAFAMRRHQVSLKTTLEIIPRTTVFTTHTPVAAGHDEFPAEMVLPYLKYLEPSLHTSAQEILSWGQPSGSSSDSPLSMFILAVRMAQYCNGVSRLHGQVARRMWSHVWPGRPVDEIPISHITNGVHMQTWLSPDLASLLERYIGPDWDLPPLPETDFKRINNIYEEELWHAHERNRARLIRVCRESMIRQYARLNAPMALMKNAESVLNQDVLTIGFARRFATYKRASLLLQAPQRLEALLNNTEHPVQFIFAGKAHPNDNEGKELIRRLIEFASLINMQHKLIFLEDYDQHLAHYLVQGADVWLNTPRRPMEACGTSGMKAAANGVLNISILDGWWCEGYAPELGWRIGSGEEYTDQGFQDSVDCQALFNILENDVIPCFYERNNGSVPTRWVKMMKASMKMALTQFSSQRMVMEYERKFYIPAANQHEKLFADGAQQAIALQKQRERLEQFWQGIQIDLPSRNAEGPLRVGETVEVSATVNLGELTPDEVDVELYYGVIQSIDTLVASQSATMQIDGEKQANGKYLYQCSIVCQDSGRYGFTVRVTPHGDNRLKYSPAFITWAS